MASKGTKKQRRKPHAKSNGRATAHFEGNRLVYDVTDVPAKTSRRQIPTPDGSGDFRDRVLSRQVDLNALIEEGLPELEYLPAAEGRYVRSRRHQVVAPRKTGKSLVMTADVLRMAEAGATIIVLDRENGALLFAKRMEEICDAWGWDDTTRREVSQRIIYVEFPRLNAEDGEELAKWAGELGADLVVFDAQRMFLTDLGLGEDASDDYAKFMHAAIEPLFEAGIATLVLDNTGHGDPTRARGSAAKGDLHEILFWLEKDGEFSATQRGRVKLVLPPGGSRFGHQGEWTMALGDGHFGEWRAVPESGARLRAESGADELDGPREQIMKLLRRAKYRRGLTQTKTVGELKGGGYGEEKLRRAYQSLVADGSLEPTDKPGVHRVPRG